MMTPKALTMRLLAMASLVVEGCGIKTTVSGFAPVYPAQTWSMQAVPGADAQDILDWVKVDSLQPTLRWEPFPGTTEAYPGAEVKPFVVVDQNLISDITYDLKIWAVSKGAPGEVVYEREGIVGPSHRLETPLQPKTKYDWSVRARFKLDGKTRVTEWSLSQLPCLHGFTCARVEAQRTGTIPPRNYYRFQTPG